MCYRIIEGIFKDEDSKIRMLIASSAFGMGVNIPDVDVIVHLAGSPTVHDYWQRSGMKLYHLWEAYRLFCVFML